MTLVKLLFALPLAFTGVVLFVPDWLPVDGISMWVLVAAVDLPVLTWAAWLIRRVRPDDLHFYLSNSVVGIALCVIWKLVAPLLADAQ